MCKLHYLRESCFTSKSPKRHATPPQHSNDDNNHGDAPIDADDGSTFILLHNKRPKTMKYYTAILSLLLAQQASITTAQTEYINELVILEGHDVREDYSSPMPHT